jgi:hypothetical protein
MTKVRNFIVMAIICLCAITSNAQFSAEQAQDLILNQVLVGELDEVDVFMMEQANSGQNPIMLENNKTVQIPYASNWVFFIDDLPLANWAHPCRYILVDASNGDYQEVNQDFFPVNWETDYITLSEMPRPSRTDLPENPDAVINTPEPDSNLYAVIINGSDEDLCWNDISAIYCTLLDVYGYTKDNIFVHYVNGYSTFGEDFDGDIHDDIDFDAYKTSIHHTFREMSGETNTSPEIPELGPEDQLFIFVDDHGYYDINDSCSYLLLPGEDLADFEMAEYLENVNCAQIMALFQPCQIGGFVNELSDYNNYNISCKNRSIQSVTDTTTSSYPEYYITGGKYSEFTFYWTAAARGYYPLINEPWTPSGYEAGSFPFDDYFDDHPGDYNPDLDGDGFVQMEEAFDYANDMDSWTETGFFDPAYVHSFYCESPQNIIDIKFNEDLLMLSGLAGHVENSQTIDSRNYLIGGELTIDPGISLTFEGDSKFFLNSDSAGLQVKPEGTLTLKSELQFSENSFFHIEPGGKSVIDGGTLTNLDTIPWQGIQVWGDETAHQYPDANGNYQQGYLKLINGATIENAIIAIDLWEPGDYSTTGGIVHATDAIFRNNAKSIHALHYNNYNPYDTTQEMDYNSNFKNCTFEITEDYLGDETFYKHVDLAHVKGIDFQGCDFSLAENVDGVSTWNHAIAGYDAKFGVKAICNSQQTPCPEEDYNRSTFTGFYSAINAVNDGGSIVAFNINRADFIDNAYGVKTREMNNASVLFSDFEIGYLGNCGAGIYSDDVTGFAFEENNFSKYSVGPQGNSPGNYFGIVINNSEAVNKVYKNTFDGLSYANFSDGKNWRDDYRYEGLVYYCNQNSNNYADFYVADYVYPNHSGIQSFQGNDNYTAGNSFTQNGATWHFYNGGEHLVSYYYNQNQNDETPDGDKIYHVAKVGRNVINNCPSHYGGSSELKLVLTAQQKADAEQDYYDNLTDYNSVKTLYDSYVDGGDTEAEKLDIQTAQPEDMWELRAQLLGDSPHLSLEVLKKAADKTDVFTESALFDILAANPDELKKDTLISYLENKEEPLPEYMIDLLKQLAEGTTYKTALQQQMAGYKHAYTRAAHDIIRSNLNDTVTDNVELRNWLDNLGGITSDRQIIATYISEDNFAEALALANMLPQLYQLEGNELTEHNYYMDMLSLHQTLYQEGRNTFQLDSTEKANIIFIANNSKGVAGAQAKSILEGVYEEYFDDCPDADGSAGCKSSSTINPNVLGRAYGLNISVKPNPAKQWAAFDYTLPGDETEATITITNATGAVIEILEVNGKQGQKLWDTRKVKPGVYIYTIKLAGFSQSGKIVIRK